MSWTVTLKGRAERDFIALCRSGRIGREDFAVIRRWMDVVEHFGPQRLRRFKVWSDHPLNGFWWGSRASAFSPAGRIIYRIHEAENRVEIQRVTVDHDYRTDGETDEEKA